MNELVILMLAGVVGFLSGTLAAAMSSPSNAGAERLTASHGKPRSPHWRTVEKAHLAKHPSCAACGGTAHLQVHHLLPFSWPGGAELELVEENLLTLCASPSHNCHLWIGHLGDFKSRNPHARADAATWLKKISDRPYPSSR